MSLLKLIIKDIEDVSRTPSISLGAYQNGAANPGGGHPNIVEGVSYLLLGWFGVCDGLIPPWIYLQ